MGKYKNSDVIKPLHTYTFNYMGEIAMLLADSGLQIDIELLYEVEQMYELDDFKDYNKDHKAILKDIYATLKQTSNGVAHHREIAQFIQRKLIIT